MVGETTIQGKEAIRQWMADTYAKPPRFNVTHMMAEGDHVSALGEITIESKDGSTAMCSSVCLVAQVSMAPLLWMFDRPRFHQPFHRMQRAAALTAP
jgi:hypothetical protein